MAYKAPKAILNHPGVKSVEDFSPYGDGYKHDVLLKDGWRFTGGRMAGCRDARINTVADFKYANPQPEAA
jgi:hypothetical protein